MVWPNEVYQSSKTSTTILLDADKKFHSFGFQAETDYANLAQDDKHRDWYYFRRFKMVLFENMVSAIEPFFQKHLSGNRIIEKF